MHYESFWIVWASIFAHVVDEHFHWVPVLYCPMLHHHQIPHGQFGYIAYAPHVRAQSFAGLIRKRSAYVVQKESNTQKAR